MVRLAKMTVADYIARDLEKRGVTHVFELVGGMIAVLIDSLHRQKRIKIISMHHEQAAGFAAEGFARITGVPGIALATSGPGATNLLTAIGSCYFDSVPAVFITGQVNRHEMKGDRGVRQLGFQETDIVSMARPITKSSTLVADPDQLLRLLDEAFSLAISGRPGPVLLDIPMDVQRAAIKVAGLSIARPASKRNYPEPGNFLARLGLALAKAKQPLLLAGGGVNSGLARTPFRKLAMRLAIPVVNSLMAVDILPHNHPLRVGLIGSYGNRWANLAISEADLLLVLGSRLDVRQTGADTQNFKGEKQIFHVDCEPGEINNRVEGCESLVSELIPFIEAAGKKLPLGSGHPVWKARISELKDKWPDANEQAGMPGINPNSFMHSLSEKSSSAAAFIVDVGQHQMWAAQSVRLSSSQRFLTSGGMGAMGFALPAAIGACLAAGQAVVVIAGDGGFQVNMQELQTIVRQKMPIKIVIINNHCHGMVRQFQDSYFRGRVQSTVWGYSAPSFKAIASAYGISSEILEHEKDVESALACLWKEKDKPFLLEVTIPTEINAYPKMAFGKGITEMEPLAKPIDMEGT